MCVNSRSSGDSRLSSSGVRALRTLLLFPARPSPPLLLRTRLPSISTPPSKSSSSSPRLLRFGFSRLLAFFFFFAWRSASSSAVRLRLCTPSRPTFDSSTWSGLSGRFKAEASKSSNCCSSSSSKSDSKSSSSPCATASVFMSASPSASIVGASSSSRVSISAVGSAIGGVPAWSSSSTSGRSVSPASSLPCGSFPLSRMGAPSGCSRSSMLCLIVRSDARIAQYCSSAVDSPRCRYIC